MRWRGVGWADDGVANAERQRQSRQRRSRSCGARQIDWLVMELSEFTDADFRATILRALRLLLGLTVVALPLLWWRLGWRSGALLVVGAAISGSGLWEWLRLLTAVMKRMDAGGEMRPMALVVFGFFVRLVLVLGVLYGSLKLLHGSVVAIAVGLGLGVVSLTIEGLRLVRAWTV